MAPGPRDNVVGNTFDKYKTKNPIARALMTGFLDAVGALYDAVAPDSVLEVGCGEGRLADALIRRGRTPSRFCATDVSLERIDPEVDARIEFVEASAYALPFSDRSFDLVICCEVLEHLDAPTRAIDELARVAGRAVLVSTPWEPVWRALNLARGKYVRDLGNTPGHIQHFGRRALRTLVERRFDVLAMRKPLPWTVILATPRRAATPPSNPP